MASTNSGKTWNMGPNGNWASVQVSNSGIYIMMEMIIAVFDNSPIRLSMKATDG